ncbi:BolA family transcriptional regulator [Gammaproteobacteria bacterium]|nr:BolA family transcriptional regulator [Gammaproteobacteria bacterium]
MAAFSPSVLTVIDDSHRHVGHAGARDGGGHFSITISAEALDGLSRIARHRAIYHALDEMMANDIHALSIRG